MALLIDGYNLLNVTGIFGAAGPGTELHRTRLAFLNFLASSFNKRERATTTIVFDAAGAPPGLPSTVAHDGMTVHFAQRYFNADEMIEKLLEEWRGPKSLTVVSSDHRVQRAARQRGAKFIDSEVWYRDLRTTRRMVKKETIAASKPTGALSPDEVAYWLKEFGDSPSPTPESDNPFPAGYGDDVAEED
jgi:predicted RNA-binding protein with PIN domain